MKKFVKFITLFILGLLLTAFTLLQIASTIAFDDKFIIDVLDQSNIYKETNETIKKELKSSIESQLKGVKDYDYNELIDNILTEQALKNTVETVITKFFSGEEITIDKELLFNEYYNNLVNYLSTKNIEVPKDTMDQITNELVNNTSNDLKIDSSIRDLSKDFQEVKNIIDIVKMAILGAIVVITILMLILSKEKLRGLYIPLIFAGSVLILSAYALNYYLTPEISKISEDIGRHLVQILENGVINQFYLFAGIYLVLAGILAIVKKILNKKKIII